MTEEYLEFTVTTTAVPQPVRVTYKDGTTKDFDGTDKTDLGPANSIARIDVLTIAESSNSIEIGLAPNSPDPKAGGEGEARS